MTPVIAIDFAEAHGARVHRSSPFRATTHNSARNSHISDALLFTWLDDPSDCEDEFEEEVIGVAVPLGSEHGPRRDEKTWEALEGKAADPENQPPPLPPKDSPKRRSAVAPGKPSPWDGDNDPANPQNWPRSRQWANMVLVGWICFVTPLASSMLAPGLPELAKDLNMVHGSLAAFSLSVFLLGSGTSALLAAPLSEVYGRVPVYHVSNGGFTIFTMACGFSPNTTALIIFRFLAGCFGSSCLAIAMGSASDMFSAQLRARAGSSLVLALMLGPCLGPVLGGLLVTRWGWRSVFYALACLGGINILLSIGILRETYAPVILRHRARLLRCKDCNEAMDKKSPDKPGSERTRGTIRTALKRPLKMLTKSPVVTLVCLFSAMVYAILYLVITTIPFVFAPRYGFTSTQTGFLYLAPGVGMVIGLVISGQLSDRMVKKMRAAGQRHAPEDRLPTWLTLPSIILVVCGLLLYGWTTHAGVHWAVPLIGLVAYGMGLIGLVAYGMGLTATTSASLMYLVECHLAYAASVSAANSVLRSLLTGFLPLGGLELYNAIGIAFGTTLLAGLAAVSAVVLFVCRLQGAKLRARFPLKL